MCTVQILLITDCKQSLWCPRQSFENQGRKNDLIFPSPCTYVYRSADVSVRFIFKNDPKQGYNTSPKFVYWYIYEKKVFGKKGLRTKGFVKWICKIIYIFSYCRFKFVINITIALIAILDMQSPEIRRKKSII